MLKGSLLVVFPYKQQEKTVMYSFLSQGMYLCHGTCRVWTSFRSRDLEIAHLVERFSSLQRWGTFCTLNNRKTWGAVKWGMEESCSGKGEELRILLFLAVEVWIYPWLKDSFKTLTQCSIARNWFLRWDNKLWFAFCKDGGNLSHWPCMGDDSIIRALVQLQIIFLCLKWVDASIFIRAP